MPLTTLLVEDLRCLQRAELEFSPGLNLIFGANGAGKTSILEAAFMLGRGRSFRTRNNERLIRQGAALLRVVGRTQTDALGVPHAIGLEVSRLGGTRAKLDGTFVESLAELSSAFSVQVIDPEIHKLIEDGPQRRRRWLDWLVFHVEPGFVDHWLRYSRAVRQRNAALKLGVGTAEIWNLEVARQGEAITTARRAALERLLPRWEEVANALGGSDVRLNYHQGWPQDVDLAMALVDASARDRERETTTVGPHRADVAVRVKGRAAREVLSRGQQKVAAVAMVLSQVELLQAELELTPTLLLDDPAAELDAERLAAFIGRVQGLGCQLIVTAIQSNFSLLGTPDRLFHVEQGRVARL